MIQPPFLQKNDTIGIVSPGRKLDTETIDAAIRIIESWGFRVRLGKNIFSNNHAYMAGTDQERLTDLQAMLDDTSVQAVVCARGGYGTTRILDTLDFRSFIKEPKWICGFSDITALHLKLQAIGIKSIHSTMPVLFSKSESGSSVQALQKILTGQKIVLLGKKNLRNKEGEAKGELIGGNLSLIIDSLGTNSEIDTENKILILEEVDEYFYRIDRMMTHLKRAKKLDRLAGLVIGYMTDIKESELAFLESIEDIILNHTRGFSFPVAFSFPVGHENPNLPWIQGSKAALKVSPEKSEIIFP